MAARPFLLVAAGAMLGCSFDAAGTSSEPAFDAEPPPLDSGAADSMVTVDAVAGDAEPADVPPPVDASEPDEGPAIDVADAPALMCDATGELPFGGHCYSVDVMPRSFIDARKACADAGPGSHLVTINSYDEDTFVGSITIGLEAWMGLTRDPPSNPRLRSSFKWITGEPLLVDAWRGSEPDGSGECARHTGTGWADSGCGEAFAAICERE